MSDDYMDGIFDDLDPADFNAPKGETFHDFVERHIKTLRVANLAANGQIHTGCILASSSGGEWPIKDSDQDANMGEFIQRLQQEARRRGADRFLIYRRSEMAVVGMERDVAGEANSPEHHAKLLQEGQQFVEGIFFYAEDRSGERVRRNGMLIPDDAHNLGMPIEPDPRQEFPLFDPILD